MPMSVHNRTARADIVLSAHVIKTYKEPQYRTEAMTYMATVKLFDVYKGEKLLRNIPVNASDPHVYNVTNFGDRKMCYADITEGKNYVLFLTTYKQRLSAKYDDIFGAAAKYTEHNVQEIRSQVGTDLSDWSVWSSCSHSCGAGYQVRRRHCKSRDCEQEPPDKRACNLFACKEVQDLLSYLGVYELPLGVYHASDRTGAFNITGSAKLFSLFSSVFPNHLPQDFAILTSIKFNSNYTGYFFTLSDLLGKQRLALKYSEKQGTSTITLEYNSNKDMQGSSSFEVDTRNNTWHQFAIAVKEDIVQLHIDCGTVLTREFARSNMTSFSSNMMMSLGPYFARYGAGFEGEIEQLLFSDHPDTAGLQCSEEYEDSDRAIKDASDNKIDEIIPYSGDITQKPDRKHSTDVATIPTTPTDIPAEWTEWSPCSRTCGRGVQSRTLYCGNNVISDCARAEQHGEEIRWCFKTACTTNCHPFCENGGTCLSNGSCACQEGYTGRTCNTVVCKPMCANGGRCVAPGVCACPIGYTGRFCETAICTPPCGNGGMCVQPGYCTCPYGYMPPSCEPICLLPCRNGGKCVRFDKCKCPKGYIGRDCSIPVCRRGCYNGGRCISPNTCSCPRGFHGSRCHKAQCDPPCQNKGRCLYPGVCQCKRGYGGALCENHVCRRQCQNGGVCAANNTCNCPDGYRGRWCHKKNGTKSKCLTTCLNGGKCRKKRCRCAPGFSGSKCEKRECKYETYMKLHTHTYRKMERRQVETFCGPWRWSKCVETRTEYVLATKASYRAAYRCT